MREMQNLKNMENAKYVNDGKFRMPSWSHGLKVALVV
jgi:hypothetical protein